MRLLVDSRVVIEVLTCWLRLQHGAFRQLHLCHADNEADERQVDNILESKVSKVIAGSLGALLVYYAQVPQGGWITMPVVCGRV